MLRQNVNPTIMYDQAMATSKRSGQGNL